MRSNAVLRIFLGVKGPFQMSGEFLTLPQLGPRFLAFPLGMSYQVVPLELLAGCHEQTSGWHKVTMLLTPRIPLQLKDRDRCPEMHCCHVLITKDGEFR